MGTASPQEMLGSSSQWGSAPRPGPLHQLPLHFHTSPVPEQAAGYISRPEPPRKQKLSRNAPKRQRTDITQQLSIPCPFWRTKQRQPLMWKLQLPESQAGPTARAVFCNNTKAAFVTLTLTKTSKPITICLATEAKSSECTTKLPSAVPTDTGGWTVSHPCSICLCGSGVRYKPAAQKVPCSVCNRNLVFCHSDSPQMKSQLCV